MEDLPLFVVKGQEKNSRDLNYKDNERNNHIYKVNCFLTNIFLSTDE